MTSVIFFDRAGICIFEHSLRWAICTFIRTPLELWLCSNGRHTGIDKWFVEMSLQSIQQKQKTAWNHTKNCEFWLFFSSEWLDSNQRPLGPEFEPAMIARYCLEFCCLQCTNYMGLSVIFLVKYTRMLWWQKPFLCKLIRTVLEKSRLVIRTLETSGWWISWYWPSFFPQHTGTQKRCIAAPLFRAPFQVSNIPRETILERLFEVLFSYPNMAEFQESSIFE